MVSEVYFVFECLPVLCECMRGCGFMIFYMIPTSLFVISCDQKESTHTTVRPTGKQHHQREIAKVRLHVLYRPFMKLQVTFLICYFCFLTYDY